MEDMDIDLEVGSDPIQQFLQHKLKEIQVHNEELTKQINRRKELISTCLENIATELNQDILEITSIWHRKLNGKWIIGIEVINNQSIGTAKDLDIVLQWDSPVSFVYHTNVFCRYKPIQPKDSQLPKALKNMLSTMEIKRKDATDTPTENEWLKTTEIDKSATILISFPIPELHDKCNFNITGILTYQYRSKYSQLNITPIEITFNDLTNKKYEIKNFEILNGCDQAFLSLLSVSNINYLVTKFSVSDVYLENLFEFDCLFKKINIISKTKNFFYVDDISESIDGSLIMLEKEYGLYNIVIYSRDNHSTHFLLHYIYKQIPNVLLIPKNYESILGEDNYQSTQSVSFGILQDKLKSLGKAMESQIQSVQKFCNTQIKRIPEDTVKNNENIDLQIDVANYQNFRHELSDLELKSDVLYNSICKLTGTSKVVSKETEDTDI